MEIKKRVPSAEMNSGKKNAVFLAIYVEEISPWKYFKDQIRHTKCPALIMIDLKVLEAEFLHIYYHILNNFARSTLLHAYEEGDESHFMSEITGIKIVPIVQHDGKGIRMFLQNSFAGSAKEELEIILKEILEVPGF